MQKSQKKGGGKVMVKKEKVIFKLKQLRYDICMEVIDFIIDFAKGFLITLLVIYGVYGIVLSQSDFPVSDNIIYRLLIISYPIVILTFVLCVDNHYIRKICVVTVQFIFLIAFNVLKPKLFFDIFMNRFYDVFSWLFIVLSVLQLWKYIIPLFDRNIKNLRG